MGKIRELYMKYRELIRYIIVGGMTTVVSLGTYYLLVFTVLDPKDALQLQIANVISWIAAVTFSYFASKNENVLKEMIDFYIARLATLGMDMGIMFVFVTLLGCNDKIMKIIVQFVVTIANYVFAKLFVFKKGQRVAKEEQKPEE